MFMNSEQVMHFAARIRATQAIEGSSVWKMSGNNRRSTENDLLRGLTIQQIIQQAENVVDYIRNLRDPAHKEYLLAKYFYQNQPKDIETLMARVLSRYSGCIQRRGVQDIVMVYLNVPKSQRAIRESLKCGANQVKDHINKVYDALDPIHYQALDAIDQKFIEVGLIERRQLAVNC